MPRKIALLLGLPLLMIAALAYEAVEGIKAMQAGGELKMRLYVMLSDDKSQL